MGVERFQIKYDSSFDISYVNFVITKVQKEKNILLLFEIMFKQGYIRDRFSISDFQYDILLQVFELSAITRGGVY